MPSSTACAGRVDRDRLAAQEDLARVGRRQAEQHPRQLRPPRADEPGQAEDLAGPDAQSSTSRTPDARQPRPRDFQHHVAERHGSLREDRRQLAADHQADQLGAVDLGHRPRADERAVAQDGHAVGDLRQLLEPVRDVDDADALPPQLADDAEQVARPRGR